MPATMSIISLYNYDETIFDSLTVPEAMNKQNVIDTILLKCAAFEILYPDPEFMKEAIRIWSLGCAGVWDHLYETMHYEYNPIWNKDGSYTETRQLNTGASSEAINQVVGFNSSEFTNAGRSTGSGTGNESETITRTEKGNIGVTTTQQMIKEERQIAEFNLYDYIAEDFKNRFCLLVY